MDELLIVVLFSALTGVMIGSLGTVVTFWLCGALERKTLIEKVSPELRDATIQAEYTQTTAGEASDFRQMHRAQTSSSYHLYIGTAERCYHLDRRCRCYPDWDNVKRGLTICEICRISSSTFEIGQCIFVSEQGQEVSFDPILSYFQESTGDRICKVHCMLYNGTFYTGFIRRFSTSPTKNCFVNFFYCRYVRGLDFSGLEWDAMTFWIALRCIDCTTFWTKTPY